MKPSPLRSEDLLERRREQYLTRTTPKVQTLRAEGIYLLCFTHALLLWNWWKR